MSQSFKREPRYIVLKLADIEAANIGPLTHATLNHICHAVASAREQAGKQPLQCVVVEQDWPEYEPTWRAIEARVTGATQPEQANGGEPVDGPALWWLCEANNIKSGAVWTRNPSADDIEWVNRQTRITHVAYRLVPNVYTNPAPAASAEREAFEAWYSENVNRAELPDYLPTLETYSSATVANLFCAWKASAALRPAHGTPEQKDQSAWCEYVAGMVFGWLQMQRELPSEERCIKAIAGIIERRMWVLRPAHAGDQWREAVEEMFAVNHITMPEDPREAIKKLIATEVRDALDPSISSAAAALVQAGVPDDIVKDAQRYRWLRRKACVIGKTTYCGEETGQPILDFVNLPDVTEVISRDSATTLDAAIDAAMLAAAPKEGGAA